MALLNDLSVELLSIIFECVYDSSSRIPPPRTSTAAKPLDATAPEMPEWSERNFRHPALFPYNISSVCMLWHDIVIRPPQYWRRIIFDVANDPTPFLDAFSWSSYLPIDVFVFSSANNANEDPVTKAHENSRVGSIVSRLQPEIIRCRTIIFDVTYASSLPSPPSYSHGTLRCSRAETRLPRG
ncbi:hypothetical protein BDZ97DRAFT_92310 [Flammula alnicola]|nr:hypothetical protein BDZ97DRAFT_92310 [Flammula alnicola]